MSHETLTYCEFPMNHWRQLRTNNALERIIREIRRRTRVVGAFPDGHSALMLVAARLRHIASTRWGKRRYLAMETLLSSVSVTLRAIWVIPSIVGVGRDAGNVHRSGGDVDEEQNVIRDQALDRVHLDAQEIGRCQAFPVGFEKR